MQVKQAGFASFVGNNKGDTANVFCSWVVFVVYGLVLTYIPYGYGTDTDSKKESGHCPQQFNGYSSGKYGPGAFPISLILFIVANTVFVFKAVRKRSPGLDRYGSSPSKTLRFVGIVVAAALTSNRSIVTGEMGLLSGQTRA